MKRILSFLLLLGILLICTGISADESREQFNMGLNRETGESRVIRSADGGSGEHEGSLPTDPDAKTEAEEIPPYSIFGKDDRDLYYRSTNTYPYRTAVLIDSDTGSCSGAMIGPHYVLTAAHCIYKGKEGWNTNLTVCPAMVWGDTPYGCSDWVQLWVPDEYGLDGNDDYDVGLIELEDALGDQTGWLGGWVVPDSEVYNQAMILGNLGDYRSVATGNLRGTSPNGKRLLYQIDTVPGTSGGPIIMNHNGDWSYIVGVHTGGSFTTTSRDYNSGIRYSDEINAFAYPYWGK